MTAPKKLRVRTLDFETDPIQTRPHYPPKPVSFSIKLPEWRAPKFYAWGHHTGGNNCTLADATRVLKEFYAGISTESPLLCFNNKFDMDVAEEHFKLKVPPWHQFHDAMFLMFLDDPHQRELGLKPSAERVLGMPPEEQDAVKEWVLTHKKQLEAGFPEIVEVYGGIKPSTAGAFVAYVPGNVVAPYADGDVLRAEKLFHAKYHEITVERGMGAAYDRERRLLPILLRNEREGIRVDQTALVNDQIIFEQCQRRADDWLRKALKAPTLDLDKDADVAKALKARDAVTQWTQTPTGRDSTSKKNLKLSHFRDPRVAAAYSYRQKCATMLETFIRPWSRFTKNGWMHTTWNQVRQAKSDRATGGTRTGRPSTNDPNFLNMPKAVKENDISQYRFPDHIDGLVELPKVRDYILPDEPGHLIGRRDFNQQEVRMLAHFEDGALLRAYLENPRLDVHQFTMEAIISMMGLAIDRTFTKTLLFGYIYGQGLASLAEKLERAIDEVKQVRQAQMAVLPGLRDLSKSLKARAAQGLPIYTWGGREYYCEEPKKINDVWRTFEYKLINYLVQGSSADVTKESIIRYDEARQHGRFMLSVYDENNISAAKDRIKKEMLLLRECMMSIEVDLPLMSDGEFGPRLGTLEGLKEAAPDLSRWGIH